MYNFISAVEMSNYW